MSKVKFLVLGRFDLNQNKKFLHIFGCMYIMLHVYLGNLSCLLLVSGFLSTLGVRALKDM